MKITVYSLKQQLIYSTASFFSNTLVLEWYYLLTYAYVSTGEKEKTCDRKKEVLTIVKLRWLWKY